LRTLDYHSFLTRSAISSELFDSESMMSVLDQSQMKDIDKSDRKAEDYLS